MTDRTATATVLRDHLRSAEPLPPEPPADEPAVRHLLIESIAAVAARVDAAPAPKFLARPVWVEDAYGVIAAEDKAGKSWAALDLAVAVASGGRWLDAYECEVPGPVLMFLGEGSDRKTVRRLRAVCEFHGTRLEELPIRVCHRAPNLTRAEHLATIRLELEDYPARLVVLDPLYLSVGSTNSSQLSEMGNVLGGLQYEAQAAGAALAVVHHWNQTGTGNDRKRFTGAGSAEWGRVLASVAVDHRGTTDGDDSLVELTWRFLGDEIPDVTRSFRRRVWADDLDDLTSPMHYAMLPPAQETHRVVAEQVDQDAELGDAIVDVLEDQGELSGNKLIEAVRATGLKARDHDLRRVALALADGGPLRLRLKGKTQLFSLQDGAQ